MEEEIINWTGIIFVLLIFLGLLYVLGNNTPEMNALFQKGFFIIIILICTIQMVFYNPHHFVEFTGICYKLCCESTLKELMKARCRIFIIDQLLQLMHKLHNEFGYFSRNFHVVN